jgi:hypothetical protein
MIVNSRRRDVSFRILKNPHRRFGANPASDVNANADSRIFAPSNYDGLTVHFESDFVYPEFRRRI